MNEVIQTLQNCGLSVDPESTPVEVTSVLMKANEDNLWNAFDMLSGDSTIGFTAEGIVQKVTVAYALAYAVENDLESIDQAIVDIASDKAEKLFEGLTAIPELEEPIKKRTRTPEFREEMLQYVKDYPDQSKEEVVDEFRNRYPNKAMSTLGQYFYGCRKEAGLKPNGTLGRNKSDTYEVVQNIVTEMTRKNPNIKVPVLKEAVLQHPNINLSPASAQVYVYRARSNILR